MNDEKCICGICGKPLSIEEMWESEDRMKYPKKVNRDMPYFDMKSGRYLKCTNESCKEFGIDYWQYTNE